MLCGGRGPRIATWRLRSRKRIPMLPSAPATLTIGSYGLSSKAAGLLFAAGQIRPNFRVFLDFFFFFFFAK